MSIPITLITVVRDTEMYESCIQRNPFVLHYALFPIDNRVENKGIPVRYNQFLDAYDFTRPSWFVFCHEDFEFKQNIDNLVEVLDKNTLYGPIGARTDIRFFVFYIWKLIGRIRESDKDGTNKRYVGYPAPTGTFVETFDCQCLIVHSDLIRDTGLRFDEALTFDLYVEDFCINAKENHSIPSRILAVECQHWSGGTVRERYYQQEAYLNRKYPHCCYTGTSSYSIGRPRAIRKLNEQLKTLIWKM